MEMKQRKNEGKKGGRREMERETTASQEYYIESAFHCCENKLPEKTNLEGGVFILALGFRSWLLALLL